MSPELLAKSRVLVVGDVMLDRYWFSSVDRISPEAPVPVALVQREQDRLGGAANVALNAATLGAQTTLLSLAGDDDAGHKLAQLVTDSNIRSALRLQPGLRTTLKLRVVARQQQLLRLDFEATPDHELLLDLIERFRQELEACDVVLLSDYGKGGLAHVATMIELARAHGKLVLVDPKGHDYTRYRGASLITPNRGEFALASGGDWKDDAELEQRAQTMRAQLELDALLVTRADEGMSLFDARGHLHVPAQAKEVFDVSGAGDTVIATLAALLGAGADIDDAVRTANRAAAIVVGKLGTASVTPAELWPQP